MMNVLIKTGQTQPVECVGWLVGWSCFSLFVQMSELGLFVVVIARRLCVVVLSMGLVIACSQFARFFLSRLGPVQGEIFHKEGQPDICFPR
ncbi:hypothetical protein V8C34DRAFT_225135 [Trichoderma compactum]